MITVVVNGDARPLEDGVTLEGLLDDMDANRAGVAAAVDGELVTRSRWPQTPLQDGARIDVLTAVQGG